MKNILVLLAHHDDEIFIYSKLKDHCKAGDKIHVVYLTKAKSISAKLRRNESLQTLSKLNVSASQTYCLGEELNIMDGDLYKNLSNAFETLQLKFSGAAINIIYTLAWEGGHQDHDATHLISKAFSIKNSVDILYEFPLYNTYHALPYLFRVMTLPNPTGKEEFRQFNFKEGLENFLLIFNYPSQLKTFLGLSLGLFCNLFIIKKLFYRRVEITDYLRPPHSGTLLYESRFKVPFQDFLFQTKSFIIHNIKES